MKSIIKTSIITFVLFFLARTIIFPMIDSKPLFTGGISSAILASTINTIAFVLVYEWLAINSIIKTKVAGK